MHDIRNAIPKSQGRQRLVLRESLSSYLPDVVAERDSPKFRAVPKCVLPYASTADFHRLKRCASPERIVANRT